MMDSGNDLSDNKSAHPACHTARTSNWECLAPAAVVSSLMQSESLEACLDLASPADSSCMRRTRKAELISCVLGHSPGTHTFQGGLLLDLELKEQQLVSSFWTAVAGYTQQQQVVQA